MADTSTGPPDFAAGNNDPGGAAFRTNSAGTSSSTGF